MWKKLLICILVLTIFFVNSLDINIITLYVICIIILTAVFVNSPISHGASSNYVRRNVAIRVQDSDKYQIIKPEKDIFASPDKTILVSGKAPDGTNVTIEVFGTTDMTRSNYNLENLPNEEDYIRRINETGYFSEELDLILGVNKIVVTFRNAADEVVGQKIVYVSDLDEASKSVKSITDQKLSDIMVQK